MARCIDPEYDKIHSNGPVGGVPAGSREAQFAHQRAVDAAREAHDNAALVRAVHAEARDNIVQMMSDGALSEGFRLNAKMLAELSEISSAAARRHELVRMDGLLRRIEQNARWLTRIGQSGQSHESLWTRFVTDMDSKFVDDTARLKAYFLSVISETGRGVDNNLGASVLQSTINMMRGRTAYYERQMGGLVDKVSGWIGIGGKATAQDALRWIGDVSAARQTKQRNDNLLATWKDEAAYHRQNAHELEVEGRGKRYDAGIEPDAAKARELELEASRYLSKAGDELDLANSYEDKIRRLRKYRGDEANGDKDDGGGRVFCCGYLDGEAAKLLNDSMAKLAELGIGEERVNEIIAGMRKIYMDAEDSLARNHQVSHDQLTRWREVDDFLPLATAKDNANDLNTAISIYTPGSLHMADGMTENPANVWESLHHFVRRSAYRVGMTDLAQLLYNVHKSKGADASGLVVEEWGSVKNLSRYDYEAYLRTINSGGIVSDVVTDAQGTVKRVFIKFRPDFKSTDSSNVARGRLFDGRSLNETLTGLARRSDKLNIVGKAVGRYGQTFTRFNPGFPIANSFRDFGERMYNMMNRDYYDANGQLVPGYTVATSMVANTLRAFRVMTASSWGRMDMNANTPEARYLREFSKMGLDYGYLKDLGTDVRGVDDMLVPGSEASTVPYINAAAKSMPVRAGQGLLRMIDAWNGMMNNTPAFAQYMALREHGLSMRDAGVAVGEMLNNNLTGEWTRGLRNVFPFVRPTLQAARALLRSFGLASDASGKFTFSGKGRNAGFALGSYVILSSLYGFLRDGMGETEGGGYTMDALSVSQIAGALPFMPSDDGGFYKMQVPFGMQRIALGMGVVLDRVERGVITPEDGVFHLLATIAKQVSPADFPEWAMRSDPLSWLGQAFAPALLRPMVDVVANKNFAGRPIVWGGQGGDESVEPKAYKGYATTAPWYKDMAKAVFDATGIDLAPEQVKALVKGYLGGPLRLLAELKESDNPGIDEMRKTTSQALGPWLTAMGATLYYGRMRDADMQLFFDAKSRILQDVKYAGVQWKNEELAKGRNPDAYRAWRVQQLRDAGWSESKLADLDLILRLDSELRKSNQDWRPRLLEAVRLDDDGAELKGRFQRKFDSEHSIYANAIENLNLFHGGW